VAAPDFSPPERSRVKVPSDPRDLSGTFAFRTLVDVRLADTDAFGHVNNATYLTYIELARIRYVERITGRPLLPPTAGQLSSMILGAAELTYRSPAMAGEVLTVEARSTGIGRTSFRMEYRITAPESDRGIARLVAVASSVQVMYDYRIAAPEAVRDDFAEGIEAFEGRPLRG
jgi:acyl-CoA thioester hydrolase